MKFILFFFFFSFLVSQQSADICDRMTIHSKLVLQCHNSLRPLPTSFGFPRRYEIPYPDPVADECISEEYGEDVTTGLKSTRWRSLVTPKLLLESIGTFDVQYADPFHDDVLQYAIDRTRRSFRLDKPAPILHINDVPEKVPYDKNTSAGLPYLARVGEPSHKGDVVNEALLRAKRMQHMVKHRKPCRPADVACFARAHMADVGSRKVRPVWGFPFEMILIENMFYFPYSEALKVSKSKHKSIAWDILLARGGMKAIYQQRKRDRTFACLDYSAFDTTIPPWLIHIAFDIIKENLDFTSYEDWGTPDAPEIHLLWDWLINYFIHTPIRHSSGLRFIKSGGVPSGSTFTQLIDSIVNQIVTTYCIYSTSGGVPEWERYMGDDSFVCLSTPASLTDISEIALNLFGMVINVEKSIVTTDINETTFLGFQCKSGFPFKPLSEWLELWLFPENTQLSSAHSYQRLLSLCEVACGANPSFHSFCYRLLNNIQLDFPLWSPASIRFFKSFGIRPPDKWHVPLMERAHLRIMHQW